MRPPRGKRSLIPVVAMVAIALAVVPGFGVAAVGDLSAEDMAEKLVEARGRTALASVERRLETTQRSKEAFAQLLASDPTVIAAIAATDPMMLAQTLVPTRARLDIEEIDVLDPEGHELLHLSPRDDRHILDDLTIQARAGITVSRAELASGGLLVQAAAPVKDGTGIIGTVVVGRLFDGEELDELTGGAGIVLALFDKTEPIHLPTQITAAWEQHRFDSDATTVVAEHYLPTTLDLTPDQTIMALVDISDLQAARSQRRLILVAGGGLLALTAAAAGLTIARRLTRPLTHITAAAQSISQGDYGQRLPDNAIRELDTLSTAINQLATGVQSRIDQLTSAEQDIRRSLESKDRLIASVSHELRTPLTAIVGYAQMLDDSNSGLSTADLNEMIHQIAVESVDLSNIIEDLLVASRAETGQLTVRKIPVDITIQTNQILTSIRELAATKTIHFNPVPVGALGDPGRIRQILRNLLTNSVRYGGDTIHIVITRDDRQVRIAVSDNGPTIPPDHQARVFEPYERAHHLEGVTASVGLGLTISRQLARLMNGDLTYDPANNHNTFTLTLPSSPLPTHDTARSTTTPRYR